MMNDESRVTRSGKKECIADVISCAGERGMLGANVLMMVEQFGDLSSSV